MWVAEARGKLLGMTVFGPDAANNADHMQIDALYTARKHKGSESVCACSTKRRARIRRVT